MAKEKVTLTVDTAQLEELRRVAGARSMSSAVEMALAEYLHPVDDPVGIRAGALLGAVRAGSDMAIDAFVVACAELAGGGLIVTVDGDDLHRLAAHASEVDVADIS